MNEKSLAGKHPWRNFGSIPGFSSHSDETLNRGPMTIFKDKRLTRTDCDEAGDYVVPNVLSPRDLVFRPDIGQKNCTTTDWDVKPQPKQTNKSSKMKCVVRV